MVAPARVLPVPALPARCASTVVRLPAGLLTVSRACQPAPWGACTCLLSLTCVTFAQIPLHQILGMKGECMMHQCTACANPRLTSSQHNKGCRADALSLHFRRVPSPDTPSKTSCTCSPAVIRQDRSRPGQEPVCSGAQASTPLGPASSLVRPLDRCGLWLMLCASCASRQLRPRLSWRGASAKQACMGRADTVAGTPQAKPMASRVPGSLPSSQQVRPPPPRRSAPFCAHSRAPLLPRRAPSLSQPVPCQQTTPHVV